MRTTIAIGLLWSLCVCLVIVGLSACSSAPKERIVYQRVEVPIYQPCPVKIDGKPSYPTEQPAIAIDIFGQMQALLSERELRKARELELEAALSGCAGQ